MAYVSDRVRDQDILNLAQAHDIAYSRSLNALEGTHNTYLANQANQDVILDHRVAQRVSELAPAQSQSQTFERKQHLESLMARANFDRDML